MKNVLTIARQELASIFNGLTAYVVLAVFLGLWEYLFFRNAFLVGEASLRNLYELLPWLSLILMPAVTMGTIVKERDEGTLELLLTHPVGEIEVVIGKVLAVVGFGAAAMMFAIPIAAGFARGGNFDWGAFGGQFAAAMLMITAMAALGIWISSISHSQMAAMLASAAMGFGLIMVGTEFVTANLPPELAGAGSGISILTHMQAMARGVIDFRDVWYFVSLAGIFLGLTYLQLAKRRVGNLKSRYWGVKLGVGLAIGIAILSNILGERIPGRIDLTHDRVYSLSPVSKKILKSLPDIVRIDFYASSKLPPQYSPVARDARDLLRDVKSVAGGNVQVVTHDPSGNPGAAAEASSRGIREVQFNVIGQEELQLKTGFLGLSLEYSGKTESIPFIQDTGDLEYQLIGAISKLTSKNKKLIAFLEGNGEKSLFADLAAWNTELAKQFETKLVPDVATEAAVLVVPGAGQNIDEKVRANIVRFVEGGKSALILVDAYDINPQSLTANVNNGNVNELLKPWGISVNQNVVYDLRANETVRLGGGGVSYLLPYPFWVRSEVLGRKEKSVVMPWASSLSIDETRAKEAGFKINRLLVTTKFAGTKTGSFSLAPEQTAFERDKLDEQVLGVVLEKTNGGGKVVVVGDADWLTDQFVQGQMSDNMSLGLGLVAGLTQEEGLGSAGVRRAAIGRLVFGSPWEVVGVKYGNLLLAVGGPMVGGGIWLWKRQKATKRVYEK